MLIETDVGAIALFVDRKVKQGQRAMQIMPDVNVITSGERHSQIMISTEVNGVYEGVTIGQLPHQHIEASGSRKNPVRRPAPDHKKPHEKRAIDLTDADIDAILDCWKRGESALPLACVTFVYDGSGQIREG